MICPIFFHNDLLCYCAFLELYFISGVCLNCPMCSGWGAVFCVGSTFHVYEFSLVIT